MMLYRKAELDEHAVRELVLWIENDQQLYRMQEQIHRNMTRKMAQDRYDHDLAAKAFGWLAEAGAKSYTREFGGVWHKDFPQDVRRAVAEYFRDGFEQDVQAEPQQFEPHVFKKDVGKWRERYPQRGAAVRRFAADDEFDIVLTQLLDEETDVLGIPGAYDVLADHFNNDVVYRLDRDGGDFDEILLEVVQEASGAELLSIPGLYKVAAEAYHNDVLDRLGDAEQMNDVEYPDQDVMQDAYVIQDARGGGGGYDLFHTHKFIDHSDEFGDLIKAANKHMKVHNFYPDIYYVNERGNMDLLDKYGRILKSWV